LRATNAGPNATSAPLVLTDDLPNGLTFVSAEGTGWTCGAVGQLVTCTFSGVLAVGASTSVVLVTDVAAAPGEEIINTATLDGGSESGGASTDDAVLVLPTAALPPTGAGGLVHQLLLAAALLAVGAALRSRTARARLLS
jgi:hypothetical protein